MCKTETVEAREEEYFQSYLNNIAIDYPSDKLSWFEQNIEVWRQLWRVIEFSEIILLIVDSRYPSIHFVPSLYTYVVLELKKELIIVFNKIDLVSNHHLNCWQKYFVQKYPGLKSSTFSSYPEAAFLDNKIQKQRQKYIRYKQAVGVLQLLETCKESKSTIVDWDTEIEAVKQSLDKQKNELRELRHERKGMTKSDKIALKKSRKYMLDHQSEVDEDSEDDEEESNHEFYIDGKKTTPPLVICNLFKC